jgi:SET domain-containing protein
MELDLFSMLALSLSAGLLAGLAIGILLAKIKPSGQPPLIKIAASTVSGRGVFALKTIRRDETIERCPALEVTDKDIGGELLNYVFYGSSEKSRLVVMGNGMLFNHSSTPNVAYYLEQTDIGPELILYTLRDIEKGEELFYNYGDDWWTTRQGVI